jgi:hypothetical protein
VHLRRRWGLNSRTVSDDILRGGGPLDVLSATWIAPDGHETAVVELLVKTRTGRVLALDMLLEFNAMSDATSDDGDTANVPAERSR